LREKGTGVIYVFGDYELDTQRYELRHGSSLCGLERQGFNVLVYLVQHRHRVVTKDELLEQLWPNQSVSENTLTQRLRAARRALGDSGREQRLIKTVHGRGYRFIAAVEERVPGEDASSARETPVAEVDVSAPFCPRCHHVNLSEAQFCNACGTPLGVTCSTCRRANPPGAAFCHACATPLKRPTPAPMPAAADVSPDQEEDQVAVLPPEAPPFPEAERRHLTVVFCDLVESTRLAEGLDPEDYRDVVRTYQVACTEVIERYDGYIAQLLGDALLIYFGWPTAHEDDAQRAVHAGLEMLSALADANRRLGQLYSVDLAMRVAVHTGLVVVGEMGGGGRQEQLALGATPNEAARLQALAQPDTVVISAATHALVQGYFTTTDLGVQTLRGVARPVQVYQVHHESGAQHRFEVARRRGLTPFVGRETEVAVLGERWQQVREGMGQVVVISGEAGIGKSRLVQSLYERIAHEPHMRLECRCSPYHQHSAFYPLVDLLERTMSLDRSDSAAIKWSKLKATLASLQLPEEDPVPILAALLSIPLGDTHEALSLTPQQQRQRTLTTLLAMVMACAEQQPVLLVVEDLHWVDPSTHEFLDLLIDQVPTLPLYVVFTCRPAFRPPWGLRTRLTLLQLVRLSHQQVEDMVQRFTGGKDLPSDVVHHIVTRTDGIPLFVEELTRSVLESGVLRETAEAYELSVPLPALSIPITLHDSLMARLDRLGTAKGMAQWGATLGRQFSYAHIQASSQRDEEVLQRDLKLLVDAELLYQRGVPPHATYQFKHALIQEAAYESLLRSTRQYYHQRIAQVLTIQFPDTVHTQPELAAYHYTEAGLHEEAIAYWQQAGRVAQERSAHAEAIAHLNQGLQLLMTLPESGERDQQELTFCIDLGKSLTATKGWGALEAESTYARAWELCQQTGDILQHVAVLWGLSSGYVVRADFMKHHEVGAWFFSLADQRSNATLLMVAHYITGINLFHTGEYVTGLQHLEQAHALYDPRQRPTHVTLGVDTGVFALSYSSHVLWGLGYPEQAVQRSGEALALAQEVHHPFSIALAQAYTAMLHQFRQEPHAASEYADRALALCTEHSLAYYLAWATIIQGWALAEQDRLEEGIAQMQQGLTAFQATGHRFRLRFPYYLVLLAKAYGHSGEVEKGVRLLDEAFAAMQQTGEHVWEAELHRLKGELLLARPTADYTTAEACLHQALEVARRQQAKSWELRAATSLARLWQSQGKGTAAHDLVAPVYNWFTEGFETADLQDAKALLAALET
jgi:class 3 adenylate cyclase/DNA-binding winged helix-turn-helix (wHTH) protein/predicted ATPase